jgi:glutaminase
MKAGLPTETGIGGSIVNVVPTVAAGTFASTGEANEKRLNVMTVSTAQIREIE